MKNHRGLWDRITEETDLYGEPFPGKPVVEIMGESRVIVENHLGVTEYGREQIGIRVKYGIIRITGRGLELTRMTKDQLVVSGRIDGVTLIRRC